MGFVNFIANYKMYKTNLAVSVAGQHVSLHGDLQGGRGQAQRLGGRGARRASYPARGGALLL